MNARTESELLAAKQALEMERYRVGKTQALAKIGSWYGDLRAQRVVWSEEHYRIFGMPPEEKGASYEAFTERVHPDDREAVKRAFEASVAGGLPYVLDHRLLLPDGTLKWVQERWEIFYDEEGAPFSAIGTTQDITDRMNMLHTLRRSDERFRLAARAMSDMVWDWDIIEDTCWWSEGLTKFGYAPAAPLSKQFWADNIHPDDRARVLSSLYAAIAPGQAWVDEYRFRKADGSYARVTDRALVAVDDTGAACRMVGAMVDVTEQRALEERLEQVQRDASLGKLAANMAHEFNNVLMGIQPFVEVIRRVTPDIPKVQDATARIAKSVKRGKDITDEILRLTRRVEPVPQPAEARHWLLDLASQPASGNGAAAAQRAPSTTPVYQRLPKMVLIVDDEPAVVDGISMLLASEGVPSAGIPDGRGAIAAIKRHGPDVVLLDIGLPDVSGVDVFHEIHQRWPDLPVVLMTGHYSRSDLGSILNLPSVRFLQKPFDANELMRALEMAESSIAAN